MEQWKDIKGFEGYYQVSNKGNVRSLDRIITCKNGSKRNRKGKMIKPGIETCGYSFVQLSNGEKSIYARVHRLVADAFIENKDSKPQVNHIDGNKQNNDVSNLEYCTHSENMLHAYKNNLRKRIFPVEMLDKDSGKVLRSFESISEAQKYFGNSKGSSISHCVHHKKRITAYGYKWRLKESI